MTRLSCALVALALAVPTAGAQQVLELPAEDRSLTADFEDVMRIGKGDADWEALVDVTGVAFDEAGNLFISNFTFDGLRILVVGPSGELVASFGRRGEGPGEWRGPVMQMVVFRDGRVVVPDASHRAYHLFGGDGRLERMVRFPEVSGGSGTGGTARRGENRSLIAGHDGTLLSRVERIVGAQIDTVTGTIQMTETEGPRVIERISIDGADATQEAIFAAWTPPGADRGRTIGFGDEMSDSGDPRPSLLPKLLFAGLPSGGMAVADSSAWRIRVVGPEGQVNRVYRRPLPARPVDDAVRRAYRDWRLTRVEEEEDEEFAALQRSAIERLEFHPEVPLIDAIKTTWDGALWVLRTAEDGFPWETDEAATVLPVGPDLLRLYRDPSPIDVISSDGRYVGTFRAGEVQWPIAFGPGGLAAYVELDDLDVPTVIVRRIPESLR